ncbi:hypothetical protein [Chitinophaga sancti]|uniref:hypothetical protein n=1 Tax=Chitinophaga sancti TaxID=1004 RepID=UPI003F7931DC
MAIRKSFIQFEGKIEGINFFRPRNRKPEDGYIVRKNGGPTRKQIELLPSCERVRENNNEFGTCSSAAKSLRMAISPVKHLTDMNLAAQFTSLSRHLLLQDRENSRGNRIVRFSTLGNQMSGFNLNQQYLFDSVIRHPLAATLDRNTASVEIEVPVLQPGLSIVLPWKQPMYRLVFSLGTVWDAAMKGFPRIWAEPVSFISPWYLREEVVPASTVTLQLNKEKISRDECMVVAVGVEMGTVVTDSLVQWVKYTGCGKIIQAG